ncbi:MAG: glycosyltransferase [Candidatus Binatia bacterium]
MPRIEARRIAKAIWDLVLGRAPLARAARVLAVTEFERAQLVDAGCPRESLDVVPNPIDLDEFAPPPVRGAFRARFGLGDERIVLYLGRISPRKRVDLLAQAFARLADDDLRLVIAGSEMGAGDFARRAVRQAGVETRTLFTGLLEGRSRLEALADADAVAYATEGEIFGLVPLEALLCGTPVVVADDSGCGELIASTGGGHVVTAGDAAALAAALSDLLGRRDDWCEEAGKAAERVRARFGSDVVAARLEEIYLRILEER